MDMWVAKIKLVKIPRNGREIYHTLTKTKNFGFHISYRGDSK